MDNTRYICNGNCEHCRFSKGSEYCNVGPSESRFAHKIDRILTNRWTGIPILVVILLAVFELTFALGTYPQLWIEKGVDWLIAYLKGVLPSGWMTCLLLDGIMNGCGAVLSFLPIIFILFFFLTLLDDCGYMARAAYLMDKLMHSIGLHGNSFIPMLVGFGCNVSAIMAARKVSNPKDRTLTMLMIPFMSCSARLPVYLVLVASFFPAHKALVMIGLYLTGIVLSILFAFVMKRTRWFRKGEDDDIFILPGLKWPGRKLLRKHVLSRCLDYLQKITVVILIASVIIWALGYFPVNEGIPAPQDKSCLAAIGKVMEPATAPLGFDWKMNVCIITGLPAKEAIVSTMGILYDTGDGGSLVDALRNSGVFTPAVALAFMLFVLLYFPCIATVRMLHSEIGWKWALFTVVHSLALAWVVAFIAYNGLNLLL